MGLLKLLNLIMDLVTQAINSVPGSTFQQKLYYLSQCNCCTRHQINKPTTFSIWHETPFSNINHASCRCNCRHVARFICRQAFSDSFHSPRSVIDN